MVPARMSNRSYITDVGEGLELERALASDNRLIYKAALCYLAKIFDDICRLLLTFRKAQTRQHATTSWVRSATRCYGAPISLDVTRRAMARADGGTRHVRQSFGCAVRIEENADAEDRLIVKYADIFR